MKNIGTKILLACLMGIGIGIPITLICIIAMGGFNDTIREILVWTVSSALFGVLSVFTFGNDRLNFIAATVLHCAGCFGITVGTCAINGYADTGSFGYLLLIFVVVYGVLYGGSLISMKINARKANEALKEK
ncbi:MAG: DUF3021 domain-containing protein [Ruminococcaceae bacterium]|nr:DUF3021 domain-containing protein [Oscillospiraceae bacterium]